MLDLNKNDPLLIDAENEILKYRVLWLSVLLRIVLDAEPLRPPSANCSINGIHQFVSRLNVQKASSEYLRNPGESFFKVCELAGFHGDWVIRRLRSFPKLIERTLTTHQRDSILNRPRYNRPRYNRRRESNGYQR